MHDMDSHIAPSTAASTDKPAARTLHLGEEVDFDEFRAEFAFPRIAFRVTGSHQSYSRKQARDPNALPTFASINNHLDCKQMATPWYSIYSTWTAALAKVHYYEHEHEPKMQAIGIAFIDLYKLEKNDVDCLDAAKLRAHINGHVEEDHKYEYLVYQELPGEAIMGYTTAQGEQFEIFTRFGTLRAPNHLFAGAAARTENALRTHLANLLRVAETEKEDVTSRMMQSMCISSTVLPSNVPGPLAGPEASQYRYGNQ